MRLKYNTGKGFIDFENTNITLARRLAIQMKIKKMNRMISKKEFKKEVIESESLSLVQFKTEWNGACQIGSMIYDDVAKSFRDKVNFYSVDVEVEKGLEEEYGIMELPTILFFKNGEVIDHAVGMIPKKVLAGKIEKALSLSSN